MLPNACVYFGKCELMDVLTSVVILKHSEQCSVINSITLTSPCSPAVAITVTVN